jgi:quinolinate synthase
MFLGAWVERQTGRRMHVWMGECHVHAGIGAGELRDRAESNPDAEILIHPECGCSTQALWLMGEGVLPADRTHILSTGGMVRESATSGSKRFLVATETGILHQLAKQNPDKTFEPVNEYAVCAYMKTITPARLLRSLREGVFEISVPEDVRERAFRAVQRMIEIGPTAGVASAQPAVAATT